MDQLEKSRALDFLQTLHANLDRSLLSGPLMKQKVAELLDLGEADPAYRHLCSPEHAFTRGIVLPKIHSELTNTFGLSPDDAREALLAEGWSNLKSISSNTPARTVRHPFDKAIVSDTWDIYQKWMKNTSRLPLTQSCPDFSLRPPAPHKIVFEAKYFSQGSPKKAAKDLVSDLYQAFFYRALGTCQPHMDSSLKS